MKLDLIVGLIVFGVFSAFGFWSVYWVINSDLDTSKPWLVLLIVLGFTCAKWKITNGGEAIVRVNCSKKE